MTSLPRPPDINIAVKTSCATGATVLQTNALQPDCFTIGGSSQSTICSGALNATILLYSVRMWLQDISGARALTLPFPVLAALAPRLRTRNAAGLPTTRLCRGLPLAARAIRATLPSTTRACRARTLRRRRVSSLSSTLTMKRAPSRASPSPFFTFLRLTRASVAPRRLRRRPPCFRAAAAISRFPSSTLLTARGR